MTAATATEAALDAAIIAAADAWTDQGGERAIVAVDVDAIAAKHSVRPAFVAARAAAIGIPVIG